MQRCRRNDQNQELFQELHKNHATLARLTAGWKTNTGFLHSLIEDVPAVSNTCSACLLPATNHEADSIATSALKQLYPERRRRHPGRRHARRKY